MTKRWTNEQQHSTIAVAAVILGVVPDFSKGSMLAVNRMLKEGMATGRVRNRKEGEYQAARSWYQAEYEEDQSVEVEAVG
jgi:hypothetical protein